MAAVRLKYVFKLLHRPKSSISDYDEPNCISPNVGRYYGLVTGPPPAMEAAATMAEAAAMETATERF